MKEFAEVFYDDQPRVPPKREIDFGIDIIPNTLAISISPYRMTPVDLKDLKKQLKICYIKTSFDQVSHHGRSGLICLVASQKLISD